MFQKHCSDDVLLACRDGELSGRARSAVEKHLESCWVCHSRQAELEQEIEAVAETFQEQDFPGPAWVEQSRSRFLRWRQQFERNSPQFHGLALLSWYSGRRIAAMASITLIGFGLLAGWSIGRRAAPAPADIVARSRTAEHSLHRQPLCQVFRVEIVQVKPEVLRHTSRLTVWSEKGGGRFASRWEEDGVLKHGAWRPADGRSYTYNPAVDSRLVRWSGVAKTVSVADLADQGLDLQQMETAFLGWLESHQWWPISLTADLSVFMNQEGVTVTAERTRGQDGKLVLQLMARRQTARRAMQLTVQIDPLSYLPRLQRIRFETPGRAVELALFVDRIEAIPPAQLTLFEPDLRIAGPAMKGNPEPPSGRRAPMPDEPIGPILGISEQTRREVEVQYALHRLGACLGEQVEIVKQPAGRILVRALVENEQRKALLGAALRAVPFVQVEIKSLTEAPKTAPERSTAIEPGTEMTVTGSRLPIQELLEDYFKRRYEPAEVPRRIAELANDATSLSQNLLAEAWAIRRLAAEFPTERADRLSGAPRWLLEKMLQDHTTALRDKGRHLRETLQSVLSGPLEGDAKSGAAPDWPSAALQLLDAAVRVDRLTRALFAGAALPEEDPRTASRELSSILSNLDGQVRNLESAILVEFSDSPGRLRSGSRPKGRAATGSKKEGKL